MEKFSVIYEERFEYSLSNRNGLIRTEIIIQTSMGLHDAFLRAQESLSDSVKRSLYCVSVSKIG